MQPALAEFLKRSFFTNARVTVKIAAIEYRCHLGERLDRNTQLGFELGSDITTGAELDSLLVYDRDPASIETLFAELLFRHVSVEAAMTAAAEMRGKESGGLMARMRKALSGPPEEVGLRMLALMDEATRERFWGTDFVHVHGARFMAYRFKATTIYRDYHDRMEPGKAYNIYTLDYGVYVDLVGTKSGPRGDFSRKPATRRRGGHSAIRRRARSSESSWSPSTLSRRAPEPAA